MHARMYAELLEIVVILFSCNTQCVTNMYEINLRWVAMITLSPNLWLVQGDMPSTHAELVLLL